MDIQADTAMNGAYLPIGDGYSGDQQLAFLHTQLQSTTNPGTAAALKNAIAGLETGTVGTLDVSGVQAPASSTWSMSAMTTRLAKFMAMLNPNTAATVMKQSLGDAGKVAKDVGKDTANKYFDEYGPTVLAVLVGIVFIAGGIYVYKSDK